MREPSLNELERDVEATRAKLARDLYTLRSPATFAEFSEGIKQEAIGTKDALLDQAKTSAISGAQSLLDDIKARAAANPAAALVIGAGIAWRLFKHPPIATALIGAGLYGLWQAKPADGARGRSNRDYLEEAKGNLQDQAGELAAAAKDKAGALATAARESAGELAMAAKDHAGEFAAAAREQVGDMAAKVAGQTTRLRHDARDKAQELGASVAGQARAMSDRATDAATAAAERLYAGAGDAAAAAGATIRNSASAFEIDREGRDKLLLGVAGLAVAAAVGMAYQRRTQEEEV